MKKNKIIELIGGLSIAVAGIAAVVSGIKENNAENVSANTTGDTLYIDLNNAKTISTWKDGNLWLRYWDGSKNNYTQCEKVGNSGRYFKVTLGDYSSGGNGFALRCENSGSDDWKETVWISWSSWSSQNFNGLKLTSQDSSQNYRWKCDWMTYSFKNVKDPENSSIKTFRLFTRTGNNMDWWYSDETEYCIRYTVSGNETIAKMNSVLNSNNSLYFWYADIPMDADGYQYIRVDGLGTKIHNYSVWTSNSNFEACRVDYIISDKEGDDNKISRGAVDNCNPEVAKKAIDVLLSCSNSLLNGYGAYTNLNTNFLSKLSSTDESSLRAALLNDYSYADYVNAGNKYTSEMAKATSYTYGQKIDEITSYSGSSSTHTIGLFDFSSNSNITFIIVLVSLAGLTAIGGYFFYKKHKEQQ